MFLTVVLTLQVMLAIVLVIRALSDTTRKELLLSAAYLAASIAGVGIGMDGTIMAPTRIWSRVWVICYKADSGKMIWFNWVYLVAGDRRRIGEAVNVMRLSGEEFIIEKLKGEWEWEKA